MKTRKQKTLAITALLGAALVLGLPAVRSYGQHGHGGGHHGGGHFGGHRGLGHFGGRHWGGHHGGIHVGGGHHGGGIGIHVGGGHHGGVGIHLGGGHHGGGHYYGGHVFGHHLAHDYFHGGHHGGLHFGFLAGPWYGWYDDPHFHYYTPPVVVQRVVEVAKVPVADSGAPSAAPQDANQPPPSQEGLAYKRRAEEAFRRGDFSSALRYANHAIVELPRDGKLYLLTAQALLGVGEYQSAAAAIHQGVALLDAKDWGYIVENYGDFYQGRTFVQHMEQLDKYIEKNPKAAYAYFVRGYEYGFLGYKEAAVKDLTRAFELESRDELAARLIERFGGTVPEASNAAPIPPPPAAVPSVPQPRKKSADHDHGAHSDGDHQHGES